MHAPLRAPLSFGQLLSPRRCTNKSGPWESFAVVPTPDVEMPFPECRAEDRYEESCLPGDRLWPSSLDSKPYRHVESRPAKIPPSNRFQGPTPSLRVLLNKHPCQSPRPTVRPEKI